MTSRHHCPVILRVVPEPACQYRIGAPAYPQGQAVVTTTVTTIVRGMEVQVVPSVRARFGSALALIVPLVLCLACCFSIFKKVP
jgi:hypothetical protein